MRQGRCLAAAVLILVTGSGGLFAEAWPGFRGPGGSGSSSDSQVPTKWSDAENIVWQADLPGPGSSSVITTGNFVFVTCYSGYGIDRSRIGEMANLERHVLCFDRLTGKQLWKKTLPAKQPEDPYSGMMAEHGYATSTPVTDGERVYAFFGKSGVYAFDLAGNPLWHVNLGTGSAPNGWGSGASPVLYKNLLIVNANAEGDALVGLDKLTGREVWRAETKGYKGSWSTPVLLTVGEKTELVVSVPGEVWGVDPTDGGLLWFCETGTSGTTSPITRDGIAYLLTGGPRGPGAMAIRGGGREDVTKTHLVWRKNIGSYVPSPVLLGDKLVWVDDRGLFHGLSSKTGEELLRERVPNAGGVYSSLVAADDKLFCVSRRKGTFVLQVGTKLEQVAHNVISSDESDFNASPAIQDGQIFLRSNQRVYCIGKK